MLGVLQFSGLTISAAPIYPPPWHQRRNAAMRDYHKIQTVWHRDPANNHKTLLEGKWAEPEFEYLADNQWHFTEKVDGTNIRVIINEGRISFGGKTDNASLPAPLVSRLESRFHPQRDRLLEMFPHGGCLYGEGYGARIQKGGGNYRPDQDFVLFDILVPGTGRLADGSVTIDPLHPGWWLGREDQQEVAGKLGLDIVPLLGTGTLYDMIAEVRAGFDSVWGDFMAEGIVARPTVELRTRSGHRIITKLKHRDFG
jgi:RNA ligase